MTYKPARTTTHRIPTILVAGLLVVGVAIAAALGYPLLTSSSSPSASPIGVPRSEQPRLQRAPQRVVAEPALPAGVPRSENIQPAQPSWQAVDEAALPTDIPGSEAPRPQLPPRQAVGEPASAIDIPRSEHYGGLGETDGAIRDGTTVFDDEIPGVAKLNPDLLNALRQAATDATNDGIEFYVTSGWRSPEYQNQLLREAIFEYGSQEEAARWVATADTSPHVSGAAVDIGPYDAMSWLSQHGAQYGLCQIYGNEPWHYELRPEAIDQGCPSMYTDPTHDPRMQR